MYPVLFRLGSFEVSSFGVMVALGVLLGLVVIWREMDAAVSMPVAARKRRGSPSSEG